MIYFTLFNCKFLKTHSLVKTQVIEQYSKRKAAFQTLLTSIKKKCRCAYLIGNSHLVQRKNHSNMVCVVYLFIKLLPIYLNLSRKCTFTPLFERLDYTSDLIDLLVTKKFTEFYNTDFQDL